MRNSREEAEYLRLEQALQQSEVFGLEPETGQTSPRGDLPPIRPLLEAQEAQQMPDECVLSDLTPVRACSHTLIEMAKGSSVNLSTVKADYTPSNPGLLERGLPVRVEVKLKTPSSSTFQASPST